MLQGAEDMFRTTTFNDLFLWVRNKRQEFGMEIDSDKAFEETKEVITRFRKVVGLIRVDADECRSWEELLSLMLDKLNKMEDVPVDRNEMVFFSMRNDWAVGTVNYINQMIQEEDEDAE